MATQAKTSKSASSRATQLDQYVNRQLRKTTRQVRFSDIVTGLLTIGAYILAFFFLAALIDAWIWPLNTVARGLALLLFVVGLLAITWYALLPLFLRRINPQYAARMIEEGRPGFKNSLLNYLALKRTGQGVHRAILNEVSKRAATDLSTVTIDAAVDKTNVIRAGFVLVGLVAICVAYLIFSPKNPLPTVMRVLAPGSKIARPAAVRIQDVTPGDTSVFFGERQQITAQIVGKCDDNDVRLVYSTQDQQIVDAVVPMQPAGSHGTWSAVLETGPAGIQQPLDYHIAARDGVSPTYSIEVRPNPAITVNSIEITPPAYTKLPPRTIEGSGEVQAVEGSRIDISATANLPIEVAYLVPLVARDDTLENKSFRELRSINMKSEGSQASGHFTALLNSNRDRALFTHYKIKFRSENDYENEQANTYPVRVIADLAPEVEILQPRQQEIALPANQPLRVEIRASDLDYDISSVDLHIDHQGTQILDRNLHLNTDDQDVSEIVQVTATLTPADLNLQPGDKAIMFATAADNRVSPSSQLPDPNLTRTDNYTLIITEPIENPEPVKPESQPDEPSEENNDANRQESDQGDEPSAADPERGATEPNQQNQSDTSNNDQGMDPSDPQSDDSASPENEQAQPPGSQSSRPSDSGNQSREQQGGQSGSDGNESEATDSQSSDETDSSSSQSDGSESSGTADQQTGQEQSRSGSDGRQQDAAPDPAAQDANGTNGGEQSESSARGPSTNQNGDNRAGQADGPENRDESLRDGEVEPLSENASEGEQFERLKEYFDQQSPSQNRESDSPNSDRTDNVADQESEPSDRSQPNEPAASESAAGQTGNDGERSSSEPGSTGQDPQPADAAQSQPGPNEPTQPDTNRSSSRSDQSEVSDPSEEPSSSSNQNENSGNQGNSPQQPGADGNSDPSMNDAAASQETESNRGQPASDEQSENSQQPGGSESQSNSPSSSSPPSDGQPFNSPSSNPESKGSGSSKDGQDSQQGSDPSASSNQNSEGSDPSQTGSNQSSSDATQDSQATQSSQSPDQSSSSSQPSSPSGNQGNQPSSPQAADANQTPSSNEGSGQPASADNETVSEQANGQSDASASSMNGPQPDSQRPASDSSSQPGDAPKTGGTPGSGGQTGNTSGQSADQQTDPEEANLEYTKKVTDLVLNKLEEQKFEPDQELLDQMNWTKQDLERFLKQWREMKANAAAGDKEAQKAYAEALQSLGLRRETRGRQVDVKRDDPFQLNEDGAVDQIPAEYVDKFNSFLKRRNRSKRNQRP